MAVGGALPAAEVDRVESSAHHLHCLRAGERTEGAHRAVLGGELRPEPFRAVARQREFLLYGAAKTNDVSRAVIATNSFVSRRAPLGFQFRCLLGDVHVTPS